DVLPSSSSSSSSSLPTAAPSSFPVTVAVPAPPSSDLKPDPNPLPLHKSTPTPTDLTTTATTKAAATSRSGHRLQQRMSSPCEDTSTKPGVAAAKRRRLQPRRPSHQPELDATMNAATSSPRTTARGHEHEACDEENTGDSRLLRDKDDDAGCCSENSEEQSSS
ncbi:hypothetical protein Tsubulata_018353, partial [Turnera subulata]